MRSITPVLALALVGVVGLAACSLITDLNGFSSNVVVLGPDGGTSGGLEAGVGPAGDSGSNGGGGSSSGDGGDDDGGGSGGGGGGGGAKGCAGSTHSLCNDFEGSTPLSGFQSDIDPAGSLALSTERAHSGTHSLRAEIPRHAANDSAHHIVQLYKDIPQSWRHLVGEVYVFIEPLDWKDGDINLATFALSLESPGAASHDAFIWLQPESSQIGSSSTSYAVGDPLPVNEWVKLRIELDPQGQLKGRAGDKAFADLAFVPGIPLPPPNQNLSVAIGIFGFNRPAPRVVMYYDDLTLDY